MLEKKFQMKLNYIYKIHKCGTQCSSYETHIVCRSCEIILVDKQGAI